MKLIILLLLFAATLTNFAFSQTSPSEPEGLALIERLQQGGLNLFLRHADTSGMACDSLYTIGQRVGQRNISEEGKVQAKEIWQALEAYEIPIQYPVLTSPVFRARDTAELAFGIDNVTVTDSLIADDYAGDYGVRWVISEHQKLFAEMPQRAMNRIMVGHRTPAIMALEGQVRQADYPEGALIVIDPSGRNVKVLGIISLVPPPNPVVSRC